MLLSRSSEMLTLVGDEGVLYIPETGRVVHLDPLALKIFQACEKSSLGELRALYGAMVDGYVSDLIEKGAVRAQVAEAVAFDRRDFLAGCC